MSSRFTDEGVYVDTYGKISKNVVLQWGELPTSVGKCFIFKEVYCAINSVYWDRIGVTGSSCKEKIEYSIRVQ